MKTISLALILLVATTSSNFDEDGLLSLISTPRSSDSIDIPFSADETISQILSMNHFPIEKPAENEPNSEWLKEDISRKSHILNDVYDFVSLKTKMEDMLHHRIPVCDTEDKSSYFKMAPKFIGALTPQNNIISPISSCFKDTIIRLKIVDNSTVELIHTLKSPRNFICNDAYFYSILSDYKFEVFFRSGVHKVTFKVTPHQLEEIKTVGVFVFTTCSQTFHHLWQWFRLFLLFLGGLGTNPNIPFFGSKPTTFQVQENINFLNEVWNYTWQERPHDILVDLDESLIKSGDLLATIRFAGLDTIVGYGTGSHVGHCAMALRVNGELYMVESQSIWYWPKKGIQINSYKQWIQWARNADYQATWLPLKKEYSEKFNSEAAYSFFKSIEGAPYGVSNFMWGWLDTSNGNYPSGLPPEFVAAFFGVVESIAPFASQAVFTLGLNKRLGTENLTVMEIALEAAKKNLTLPDLYAIAEQDGWEYPDGVNYVCSSFVVAMYKAGGLFGDVEVNAVEFTPKDLYQLEFFDPNPVVPEKCKVVDPENPFCQIMGKYRIEFPGISTISVYAHMNENCRSEDPLYVRHPNAC